MAESDQHRKLNAAVQKGNVEEVRRLTEALSNSYSWQQVKLGFNLLCESLQNKQLEIAKLLVKHECSLYREGFCGDNALHVAVMYGDIEIVRMITNKLFSSYSKYENNAGMKPLHLFSQRRPFDRECPQILHYLLQSESDINAKHHPSGFSPIHFAAECGSVEMIALLWSAKADINGKATQDRTPLHIAAFNGKLGAVKTLLIHGANHELTDTNNKTPVCLAVESQDWPTTEVFLKNSETLKNDAMLINCATGTMNKAVIEKCLKRGATLIEIIMLI